MRRQQIGTDVLGSQRSNCYCPVIIFYFVLESQTVIHIMLRGIHLRSTTSILLIAFRWRASHGLGLDFVDEIKIISLLI